MYLSEVPTYVDRKVCLRVEVSHLPEVAEADLEVVTLTRELGYPGVRVGMVPATEDVVVTTVFRDQEPVVTSPVTSTPFAPRVPVGVEPTTVHTVVLHHLRPHQCG